MALIPPLPHDHRNPEDSNVDHDKIYPDCPVTEVPLRRQTWRGSDYLFDLVIGMYRSHVEVDDGWYSCPQSADGCIDNSAGVECTCGVEASNARVDEILDYVEDML